MLGVAITSTLLWVSPIADAAVTAPDVLVKTGVRDKRGTTLPMSLTVTGPDGVSAPLADLVKSDKPTVLTFNYAGCPMLCGLQQDGLARSLKDLNLTSGQDFTLLTVGIDPKETTELAIEATSRLSSLVDGDWRFVTAPEASITALTDAAGFDYQYDKVSKQYAHPAATYILTSDGQISQYFTAIQPDSRDIRWALVEAGKGQVGSVLDQVALTCLQYDLSTNAYVARGVMRSGGIAIVGGLFAFFGVLWQRERRRWRKDNV